MYHASMFESHTSSCVRTQCLSLLENGIFQDQPDQKNKGPQHMKPRLYTTTIIGSLKTSKEEHRSYLLKEFAPRLHDDQINNTSIRSSASNLFSQSHKTSLLGSLGIFMFSYWYVFIDCVRLKFSIDKHQYSAILEQCFNEVQLYFQLVIFLPILLIILFFYLKTKGKKESIMLSSHS